MIFAAGFGARMRPLTQNRPKPLLPIGDTCLLDHTLDLARAAGMGRMVVNAHYLADQVEDHLADQPEISVIVEDTILDTGGGFKNALPQFEDTFIVTSNSDNIWAGANPFTTLLDGWTADMGARLVCAHMDQVRGRKGAGDFNIDANGMITRGGDFVYLGVQVIDRNLVSAIDQSIFSMNLVWDALIARNALHAVLYDGIWCDVGRPENIALAETLLKDTDV